MLFRKYKEKYEWALVEIESLRKEASNLKEICEASRKTNEILESKLEKIKQENEKLIDDLAEYEKQIMLKDKELTKYKEYLEKTKKILLENQDKIKTRKKKKPTVEQLKTEKMYKTDMSKLIDSQKKERNNE